MILAYICQKINADEHLPSKTCFLSGTFLSQVLVSEELFGSGGEGVEGILKNHEKVSLYFQFGKSNCMSFD